MSSKSLVFSHQRETVISLSAFFDTVEVFTTEASADSLPKNVRVNTLPWRFHSPFSNALLVLSNLFPTLLRSRSSVVFTHMTDVHAALISPLTWMLRMRNVLWYAHASTSIYLLWSSFFVSRIVSSTPGSCNLKLNRRKIHFINQGIDSNLFPYFKKSHNGSLKILYYGRLDYSKNIHVFPSLIKELRRAGDAYSLNVFGSPSTSASRQYLSHLRALDEFNALSNAIFFNGPLERAHISTVARDHDVFLNLFRGSLDKTLIEATFMGMPVVTWNVEYCSQFGTWSKLPVNNDLSFLIEEFHSLKQLTEDELNVELDRRLNLAIRLHSLDSWVGNLVSELRGDDL